MKVFSKLNTLFRANLRESLEQVTDANAVRIYRQEIVEAEELLAARREALATTIATRRELEADIERLERRVSKREKQIQRLPEAERREELLHVAATEIASFESELECIKQRHVELCGSISKEELALRKLLSEIREHRREAGLLESQLRRQRAGSPAARTISGRLAALRETRAALHDSVDSGDQLEAGMAEAIARVDVSPVDRELRAAGRDDSALKIAEVLQRLKGQGASV
jgi:phage shock protein A